MSAAKGEDENAAHLLVEVDELISVVTWQLCCCVQYVRDAQVNEQLCTLG